LATTILKRETREERVNPKERPWFETDSWKKHQQEIDQSEALKGIMKEVTTKEMETVIKKLKNGKAGGLDQVVNEQIKYGPKELWEELRKVMNKILQEKLIPEEWKQSLVYMIHKKDDTNDPDKYRGHSLCFMN